jgi:hypothetical protein
MLDAVTVLHQSVTLARALIAAHAAPLVIHALGLGVDPHELVNRPYNGRTVASLCREAGLPPRRPGPRPVRRQT